MDAEKILADLKAAAAPELEQRADDLRATFLRNIDEFVDSSRQIKALDDLLKKAAGYEIKAVTETNRRRADQYATAAEDVLRQVSVVLIAEKIVAQKQTAALIQAAALSVWEGFKSVAISMIGVAVKGAATGLLGPVGGVVADAAGSFLGDAIEGSGDGDNTD